MSWGRAKPLFLQQVRVLLGPQTILQKVESLFRCKGCRVLVNDRGPHKGQLNGFPVRNMVQQLGIRKNLGSVSQKLPERLSKW